MTPTTDKKCAHPPCSCTVASGEKYCGPQCEAMEDTPDIDCKCQHPNCKGHAI
jgi:metallothionein